MVKIMKKREWFSLEKVKGISKNQLLIGGLAGVLLLIIALPAETDKKREQRMPDEDNSGKTQKNIYLDIGKSGHFMGVKMG